MILLSIIFYLFTGCEQGAGGQELDETSMPRTPPAGAIAIGSAADLAKIGKVAGYPLNKPYKLTADITVANWEPLNQQTPFKGAFYGEGKTITITSGAGGLFDQMEDAKVYDLHVVVTAAGGSMGGIAGFMERSVIENCTAVVTLAVAGTNHNVSAGGIVGMMGSFSTVRDCAAQGTITLTGTGADSEGAGLMVYAGGIAGYSGTPGLAGDGESGCVITGSRWTDGSVTAVSGYPYAGGVVGYNYTGAKVERCWAAGTVKAVGAYLPYAGGVAGYNSRVGKTTGTRATVENCYSTAAVAAVSTSKSALAGGVAGANAAGALISKCYATGAVSITVAGSGTDNTGNSTGVMIAANAGGIAGAQYVADTGHNPTIAACAALSPHITGIDSAASGAVWNIYRIAGAGTPGSDTGVFAGNIAYSGMVIPHHAGSVASNAAGRDGADCAEKPVQSAYAGWDFSAVWTMSGGYPVLR
jgi:hypothetical protein